MPEHFADRLAALVEERRSRVVLGLDPDPAKLWPGAVREIDAGGAPGDAAGEAAEAVARALPRGHRGRGPGVRGRQAPAGVLRAPRARRAGRRWRPPATRRTSTACCCWPTASAATCPSPPPPTRRRWWARPPRPTAPSRAWAPTASRSTRCWAATRWSRWWTPRPSTAPGCSPWSAPRTPARRTCRTWTPAAGRCTSTWPSWWTRSAPPTWASAGCRWPARSPAPPARSGWPACAS